MREVKMRAPLAQAASYKTSAPRTSRTMTEPSAFAFICTEHDLVFARALTIITTNTVDLIAVIPREAGRAFAYDQRENQPRHRP